MKIGILGTGTVGQTLASKLSSLGHEVMIGTRDVSEKLANQTRDHYGNAPFGEWHKQNKQINLGTFAEAAEFGQMIINATEGLHSIDALQRAKEQNLKFKVLIDISNPLDFSKGMPPSLYPQFSNTHSLAEEIQETFPDAKVVKTFNTMWAGLMVNPAMVNNGDHTNFICGNDAEAKEKVKTLLNELGWKNENTFDLGDITSARGTEAFLLLWLRIMGIKQSAAFNFKIVS
ncbi:MAG: NADPH-dependent F420 reductase [Candidatus Saccharibacteria bacterium]